MTAAIQDMYADEFSHCYGCGRLNSHGLQIKSVWDGKAATARFAPAAYHVAVPGYVYGGLIASLLDCHGIATAAAAAERAAGRDLRPGSVPRYVTAALQVNYLAPTPLGPVLEIQGQPKEVAGRKVIVTVSLRVEGAVTARGELVAVLMPESMTAGHGQVTQP
ncbi:MAG TPA: hotdog domain-containing protein [Gemmatimonadales bacterium]|nr:hotdog domain-containing protein [Gemmatimonadales bacterium]